jgi:hypothetical protein
MGRTNSATDKKNVSHIKSWRYGRGRSGNGQISERQNMGEDSEWWSEE